MTLIELISLKKRVDTELTKLGQKVDTEYTGNAEGVKVLYHSHYDKAAFSLYKRADADSVEHEQDGVKFLIGEDIDDPTLVDSIIMTILEEIKAWEVDFEHS